jgi:hypothetical protein
MSYRILVPLNSPALDTYLRDGWHQARTEGQWAVLQMDEPEMYHHGGPARQEGAGASHNVLHDVAARGFVV